MAITKRLSDGEQIVFHTRTHVKSLFVPALVLLVTVPAAAFISTATENAVLLAMIWSVAALAILVFSVWPFLVWLAATYTVTDRRLTTRQGVLNRTGHDIPLSRISDVRLEKSMIDRMLGCGTLLVSDASDSAPITLPDVPSVEAKQLMLADQLHQRADAGD